MTDEISTPPMAETEDRKWYSIVDAATLRVLRSSMCALEDVSGNAQSGEFIVEGFTPGGPDNFFFNPTTQGLDRSTTLPVRGDVNGEAERRILARYPLWKQSNILIEGDDHALVLMRIFIATVRDASNRLQDPIPLDFRDDKYWPVGE